MCVRYGMRWTNGQAALAGLICRILGKMCIYAHEVMVGFAGFVNRKCVKMWVDTVFDDQQGREPYLMKFRCGFSDSSI